MATVPVKNYRNDDEGAPQIDNTLYSILAWADAVLVNGFNPKTISGITRTGDTATATIGAGHLMRVHMVVRIAGVDQAEYLGDQRITAVTSTTFSFKVVGTPATPATTSGAITCKVAPLGFEIVFTATGKRVYRSLNGSSLKPCLRMDATQLSGYTTTWQKFARVEMSSGYSDIDTATGPIAPYDFNNPTAGRAITQTNFHGWGKWRQTYGTAVNSSNAAENVNDLAGNRYWDCIGDDRFFFFINRPAGPASGYGIQNNYGVQGAPYMFGDVKSFRPSDGYPAILAANDAYVAITAAQPMPSTGLDMTLGLAASLGKWMMRDATQLGGHVAVSFASLQTNGITVINSGYATGVSWPNPAGQSLILHPITIMHGTTIRGTLPGIYAIHNDLNRGLLPRTIIEGVDDYPDKKFLIMSYGAPTQLAYEYYTVAVDLLGPWVH